MSLSVLLVWSAGYRRYFNHLLNLLKVGFWAHGMANRHNLHQPYISVHSVFLSSTPVTYWLVQSEPVGGGVRPEPELGQPVKENQADDDERSAHPVEGPRPQTGGYCLEILLQSQPCQQLQVSGTFLKGTGWYKFTITGRGSYPARRTLPGWVLTNGPANLGATV